MLVDANILLFSVDSESPYHERAAAWLTELLNRERRVAHASPPWPAVLRIATHPRATPTPLSPIDAWRFVDAWLAAPTAWTPVATEQHADVLGGLITKYRLYGNLVPDGHLAALAIEHGLELASADTDFARFAELRWVNPLAG